MSINTCLQFFKIMNTLIIREVVAVRRRWERPITSIQFPILWKPCGCLLLQSRGSKTFRMLVMIFRPFSFVSFLKVYIAKWIEKVVLYFLKVRTRWKWMAAAFHSIRIAKQCQIFINLISLTSNCLYRVSHQLIINFN